MVVQPRDSCPENSFRYNSTLCACDPGYFFFAEGGGCALLDGGGWAVGSGVGPAAPTFLVAALSLDSVERLLPTQAAVVRATLVVLLFWLSFCVAVRFGRLDRGRTVWFRVRWWVSRHDLIFATKHQQDDRKVVMKRKTELGGTFSVASWILFLGLLSALLYQIITERSFEVHKVRPTNGPDLLSFFNDIEFNITTISSMTCTHLRGLDKFVIGMPGSIDYKVFPLSTYSNYSCYNTSRGPTISLTCKSCRVPRGNHYISWQFVDLPNDPATAVGFQFNLSAKDHGDDRHVSFVSGTLKSGSYINDAPKTFRGPDMNILKIHLFPQKFNYLHNLKLIQPLFHDFLPGSSFSEASNLQASLESSKDGLVNTALYISYLSDYIVEIDQENVLGLVSFFADVGGLYAISLGICLFLLSQCEARIKKLHIEDSVIRDIRSQRRAQRHWDKLRKYVMYTWGCSNLDIHRRSSIQYDSMIMDSFCGIGSLHKMKQPSRSDSIYLNKMANIPKKTNIVPVPGEMLFQKLFTPEELSFAGGLTKFDGEFLHSEAEHAGVKFQILRETS